MGRRFGKSSERIARQILKNLGLIILETDHDIVIDDVKVGEIDIIAKDDDNNIYAVEVKRGYSDVSSLRQIYANAKILGYKPMIVCKNFSDKAAKKVSEELGIKVIKLSEFFLIDPEELEIIIRESLHEIFDEYGFRPIDFSLIEEEDLEVLKKISVSETFKDVAETLGLNEKELGKILGNLRSKGIFPIKSKNFQALKKHASRVIHQKDFDERIKRIESLLEKIIQLLKMEK